MKTFRSISRIKIFYSESVVEYIEGVEPQGFLQTTVYLKLGDPSKMTKINLANKRAARSRNHRVTLEQLLSASIHALCYKCEASYETSLQIKT